MSINTLKFSLNTQLALNPRTGVRISRVQSLKGFFLDNQFSKYKFGTQITDVKSLRDLLPITTNPGFNLPPTKQEFLSRLVLKVENQTTKVLPKELLNAHIKMHDPKLFNHTPATRLDALLLAGLFFKPNTFSKVKNEENLFLTETFTTPTVSEPLEVKLNNLKLNVKNFFDQKNQLVLPIKAVKSLFSNCISFSSSFVKLFFLSPVPNYGVFLLLQAFQNETLGLNKNVTSKILKQYPKLANIVLGLSSGLKRQYVYLLNNFFFNQKLFELSNWQGGVLNKFNPNYSFLQYLILFSTKTNSVYLEKFSFSADPKVLNTSNRNFNSSLLF